MITKNFYNEILLTPAQNGGDELNIVSGYATAAFAARHLEDLLLLPSRPTVHLIVGMFPQIGNLRENHLTFQRLSTTDYPTGFECRYIVKTPPVHAKAYVWHKNDEPLCAFVGSVNYSKNAFNGLREAATSCDVTEAKQFFDTLWNEALDCRDKQADDLVAKALLAPRPKIAIPNAPAVVKPSPYANLPSVNLPLVMKNGKVQKVAGLNWGQRPGREQNQAYITIPSSIAKGDFFPPIREPFTVIADDDTSLICVRAQPKKSGGDIGYAIQTPRNNSDLGIYFRRRLGVASGLFVDTPDLLRYGRSHVTFYKIDDETYYMDFARP